MKITLDTREDKEEIRKVIRLLQQIVGEHHSSVEPSPSTSSPGIFNMFGDNSSSSSSSSPSTSSTSVMGMFDEPKKEEVSPSVFNLFGDNPPASLKEDNDDDDEPEPIQIIDF